jgi:nitroimidazol reductase NimA-like FMN-containing flavoprotein (pyridoxamine 5'-phosphate oxidase superfamily)
MFSAAENEFLKSQSICRIATVSSEGWPHNVPVVFAFDGAVFYVRSHPGEKKLKNIAGNNRVCLIIDVPQKPSGIMVQGLATLIEHGSEFGRINEIISQQRGWKKLEEGEQVAITVQPTKKVSWGV